MPKTTPVDVDFYDRAPIHFSATRRLDHSPAEVFRALADTPSWPAWFASLTAAVWTSPAPYGVGSTRRVNIGPIAIHERFIVWEPDTSWGFTFLATTIPVVRSGAERVDLVADGDGTAVTYGMFLDPLPGLGPITRIMRRGVEKSLGAALAELDRYLAG